MPRLRRSNLTRPGWTRKPVNDGFEFLDETGCILDDACERARLEDLVVPPAWTDVWLCPYPNGHIQAVGTDDAGRRQYIYHPQWQAQRAKKKHDHVLEIAAKLPAARRRNAKYLTVSGMPKERALALAFRLLDLGMFRVGGERYAESNGSYGLATIKREHVQLDGDFIVFDYDAKSHQHRFVGIRDTNCAVALRELVEREDPGTELLAWYDGGLWHDVTSGDINDYLKKLLGPEATAKDFRTWRATVLAAVALAGAIPVKPSKTAQRKAVTTAVKTVSKYLGNTPTVCRSSYIDPRLIDLFEEGLTIIDVAGSRGLLPGSEPLMLPKPKPSIEKAVLTLL